MAIPRPTTAPPADPGGDQVVAARRKPRAAPAPGGRKPPLDRYRDAGRAGEPDREPPGGAGLPPRDLSPRVPARLGEQDLLHATPSRPAVPCTCTKTPDGPPGRGRQPCTACPTPGRAHRGESLISGGERPHAGRDSGARRGTRGLSPGKAALQSAGAGHGAGDPGRAHGPAVS